MPRAKGQLDELEMVAKLPSKEGSTLLLWYLCFEEWDLGGGAGAELLGSEKRNSSQPPAVTLSTLPHAQLSFSSKQLASRYLKNIDL